MDDLVNLQYTQISSFSVCYPSFPSTHAKMYLTLPNIHHLPPQNGNLLGIKSFSKIKSFPLPVDSLPCWGESPRTPASKVLLCACLYS